MSTITIGNGIANAYVQTGDLTGNLNIVPVGGLINASSIVGAVSIPSGTTDQRPSSPTNGMVRYNSSNSTCEVYVGGIWTAFP